ncbi:MAG: hypothetical protein JWM85_857 [Acidimicrobiaceae bacterium]|nr:hypothetical protein [Acidimicrobiaceae bacterium]
MALSFNLLGGRGGRAGAFFAPPPAPAGCVSLLACPGSAAFFAPGIFPLSGALGAAAFLPAAGSFTPLGAFGAFGAFGRASFFMPGSFDPGAFALAFFAAPAFFNPSFGTRVGRGVRPRDPVLFGSEGRVGTTLTLLTTDLLCGSSHPWSGAPLR